MMRAALLLFLLALTTTPAEIGREARDPDNLVAHEWGTFTTVAGEHGEQVEWLPLQVQDDLPCFVERLKVRVKGAIQATVRMETPVIYFYAPRPTTVDVSVQFPRGMVTEWFPRAGVTPAGLLGATDLKKPGFVSSATWSSVRVAPRAPEDFPTEARASHYYAARRTDAAPLRVGDQTEKFLFYRGVATTTLPVSATVSPDGVATVKSDSAVPLGTLVRFDRRDGKIGYEIRNSSGSQATLGTPALTGSVDALAAALETILTGQGLYAREARAMVDTWRESWFEEGTRLLYIVPRPAIEAMLPLEIKPRPVETVRVFVGRIELITPVTMAEVKRALETRDRPSLMKYGRFLLPISRRLAADPASGLNTPGLDRFIYGTLADATRGPTCGSAPGESSERGQ
jgi:hypothetical protein